MVEVLGLILASSNILLRELAVIKFAGVSEKDRQEPTAPLLI